jgi:hypothetical protein
MSVLRLTSGFPYDERMNDTSKQQAARTLAAGRRTAEAVCMECGTPMTGTARRRYCSPACGQRALRRRKAQQVGITTRAERDLPSLRRRNAELLEFAERAAGRIAYDPDDQLRMLMCCFYLHRQIDHTRSLLALGASRDLRLIARSMIEGAAQFAWAVGDLPSRAARWLNYRYVHEWRKLRNRRLDGEPVDAVRQATIDQHLQTFGPDYYNGPARKAVQNLQTPKGDPYDDNWTGMNAREVFEAVQFEDKPMWLLYAELYSAFSDWQHWNVGGWDEGMAVVDGRFAYSLGEPADASNALRAGFFSLWLTLGLVDQQLGLGLDNEVKAFGLAFNEWWEAQCRKPLNLAPMSV